GRRIRTLWPSRKGNGGKNRDKTVSKNGLSSSGTEGSNPSCSSAESCANMTCPSRQDRLSSAGAVADEGAAGIGRSDREGCGATIRSLWPLMPAALGVAREGITAGDVWVATGADGQIAGVVALAPGDAPGALDLNKLF